MNNLKPYFDAAQAADAKVQEIAAQIDTHFSAGETDKAMALRAGLDEAKTKAKNANDLYLSMRDASQSRPAAFSPAGAPPVLRNGLGDTFVGAFRNYLKTGDRNPVAPWMDGNEVLFKNASNNTDMNIGTAADGGVLDPTTLYQKVVARRSEMSLIEKLGCQKIPGKGTTVDVPYDNEADGEFVSTGEGVAFDQDTPALAKAQMTLVKYSKYITLSSELLEDEDTSLMDFLMNWVARGQAKTINSLLVNEAAATGTSFKTAASATAIAAGEPDALALNDTVSDYLDDSGSVAWVTRASTYAAIKAITGSARLYGDGNDGAPGLGRNLLGFPAHFSNKVALPTAGLKPAFFGNWNYMGYREGPGFTMLRDPYSAAGTGQVKLWMYFRIVFKQLQAGAIGYLTMAAA